MAAKKKLAAWAIEALRNGPVPVPLNLTRAQASALYLLVQAHAIGKLAEPSKATDGEPQPWCLRVNSRAAKALEKLGLARHRCVLFPTDEEVTGADLVHRLGYWSVKYEVTPKGLRAWGNASARERYGFPEHATLKPVA